jgi:hypothetical protein
MGNYCSCYSYFVYFVNWRIVEVVSPLNGTDPLLAAKQASEARYIHEVKTVHATRVALCLG